VKTNPISSLSSMVYKSYPCNRFQHARRKAAQTSGGPYSLLANGSMCHFVTRKTTLLLSVSLGVVTSTVPVVAPVGTLVVIKEAETTLKTAAVPLNVTLVAPIRSVPRILTAAPTPPAVGSVFTNGPRPTDRLKSLPSLFAPP
jgi:hypothetical protein